MIKRKQGDRRGMKTQTEDTFGEQYKALRVVLTSHMTHAARYGTVYGPGSRRRKLDDKRLEEAALLHVTDIIKQILQGG